MSISNAQLQGQYNASNEAADYLAIHGEASNAIAVETPVTATAFQIDVERDANLYISVNTAASLAIAIGATAAGATNAIQAAGTVAVGVVTLFVPAGWYVKLTGTMANLTVTSVLR